MGEAQWQCRTHAKRVECRDGCVWVFADEQTGRLPTHITTEVTHCPRCGAFGAVGFPCIEAECGHRRPLERGPITLYLIDIDGTIADNTHRERFVQQDPPDWSGFYRHDRVLADQPIASARRHFDAGRFIHGPHAFLSSRDHGPTYHATATWLENHGFCRDADHQAILKPTAIRTMRSATFKVAALATLATSDGSRCRRFGIDPGADFELVLIDNHPGVLEAAAEAGFKTLRAPECWDDPEAFDG